MLCSFELRRLLILFLKSNLLPDTYYVCVINEQMFVGVCVINEQIQSFLDLNNQHLH